MAAKPQPQKKYADGGSTGGQPTMAVQYADDGNIGLANDPQSPASLDTPTANQNFGDYLRQQSNSGGSAGLQYTQAPATPSAPDVKGGNMGNATNNANPASVADGVPGSMVSAFGTPLLGPILGPLLGQATNFGEGYTTGTTSPDAGLSANFGANMSNNNMSLSQALSSAAFNAFPGYNDFAQTNGLPTIGGTVVAPPANPMQADPATTAANNAAAASDAGNPGGGNAGSNGNNGMGANANNNGMGANSTNGARGAEGNGNGPSGGNAGPHGGEGSGTGGAGYANGGAIGQQQMPPVQQGPNPTMATAGLQTQAGPAPAAPAPDMHPAIAHLHVQNQLSNPQVMQAIQTHLSQAIQAGKVNPQQLQMMGQLAQSAMQHPEIWPKLRQFAIQVGLPDAQKLPEQFNQQICMTLMAASQASQHGDTQGAFGNGGQIKGPGTGISDSIPAVNKDTGQHLKVSNDEYIIPADVVRTKGKEFFDNIVRKYHTPAAMQPR